MTAYKERRKERQRIMHRIDLIQHEKCKPCPINKLTGNKNKKCEGCKSFVNLNELGMELDELSNKSKNIPRKLNKQTYIMLSERGWTNHQIRSHYKIDGSSFYFFLESNGLRKIQIDSTNEKKQKKEVKELAKLSIEMYKDYRASGMLDKEIAKREGITLNELNQFKSTNGLVNKRNSPVEVIKAAPVPVEVPKKISAPVEPVNTVKEKPKGMPTIESSWNPLQDSINCYYEDRNEKSNELKEKAKEMAKETLGSVKIDVIKSEPVAPVIVDRSERIKHEYEVEKLNREIELQKELKEKAENQLRLYVDDYRNVVDEREKFKNRLEILLPEMEDLQTMNLIMMKKMISVDTVLKERGF